MTVPIVEVRPVVLRFRRPLTTARGSVSEREVVLVLVEEGGEQGWGEAAPPPGGTGPSAAELAAALEGAHLDDRLAPALGALAAGAVASARADADARRSGVALAELLHVAAARSVEVNALVPAGEPEAVAGAASAAVAAGFRCVKVKVGAAPPERDVATVHLVREVVGPDVEIRLDANGAWDEETAVEVLRAVDPDRPAYVEQPVLGLGRLAAVRARCGVPVAVDEDLAAGAGIEEVVAARAADVAVLKPALLGGPVAGLDLARTAHGAGLRVVVTANLESAIGLTAAAHLAAAVDALTGNVVAHGLGTGELFVDDVAPPPVVTAGRLHLPAGPGLGVVPDASAPTDW